MRPAYSIKFRLQRTVRQSTYVSVPITPDLLKEDGHLDADKAMQIAVRMGEQQSVPWESEGEPVVEPHPLQLPPS